MKAGFVVVLLLIMLTGCAASNNQSELEFKEAIIKTQSFELAEIEFRKQGASPANRPYMKDACRGFELSEKQVRDFFADSEEISEQELQGNLKMLPCHSVGTININDEQYSWVIRAGGIGEFFNEKNKFYKVCGRECCKKNPGLC